MAVRTVFSVAAGISEQGKFHYQPIYKSNTPTLGVAGRWADLSMGGGIPKYNAYVGGQLEATQLIGSGNNGIYTGSFVGSKYLQELSLYSPQSGTFLLCDYLMFYPLIDGDNADEQLFVNDLQLPRYSDGLGVNMALVSTTTGLSNGSFSVRYTNSNNVSSRITSSVSCLTANTGVISNLNDNSANANATTPFIPLVNGDVGVRSVQSLTFSVTPSGFYTLVLFKPLAQIIVPESAQTVEKTFIQRHSNLPKIEQGAYLNYLYNTQATGSLTGLRCLHTFTWE